MKRLFKFKGWVLAWNPTGKPMGLKGQTLPWFDFIKTVVGRPEGPVRVRQSILKCGRLVLMYTRRETA